MIGQPTRRALLAGAAACAVAATTAATSQEARPCAFADRVGLAIKAGTTHWHAPDADCDGILRAAVLATVATL